FMFGDEDSDSSRSCSASLNSPMRNQNLTGTSSLSVNPSVSTETNKHPSQTDDPSLTTERAPGYGITKGGLSITPSSPSTRLEITNAQRSPAFSTTAESGSINSQGKIVEATLPDLAPTLLSSTPKPVTTIHTPTSAPLRPADANPTRDSRLTTSASGSSPHSSSSGSQHIQQSLTRTQQKLLLQRQHLLSDDPSVSHPQNHLWLTKEAERVSREYGWTRRHHNPVVESLIRVMSQKSDDSGAPFF
ncbi:hypothetical protein L0F63_006803, partial [Massospora cicadina]